MKKQNDVTYQQFVDHLNSGNKVYMKKPRSWQKVWFWWEDKDQWFLNKAYEKRVEKRVEPEPSVWITAKQMNEGYFDFMERQGYKYYIG